MQTLLCFDYGQRKIGLAVGNTLTGTANELTTLGIRKNRPDWQQLDKLVREWQPDLLLLGLPLKMDGTESAFCRQVRTFGAQLETRYNLPVAYEDERLSSNEADGVIKSALQEGGKVTQKQQARRDQVAARLILQSYFNRHE